jgi:hypothetical protein
MRDEMLAVVQKKFGKDTRPFPQPEDDLLEPTLTLLLQEVPESLGVLVGRVMAYGDHCGWDEVQEDTRTFMREFLHGFRAGLYMDEKPESWPDRKAVRAAFGAVVGDARRATGLELLTY